MGKAGPNFRNESSGISPIPHIKLVLKCVAD